MGWGDSELTYTHPISNMQKQVNLPITVDSREKAQVFVFFLFLIASYWTKKKLTAKNHCLLVMKGEKPKAWN